MRRYLINLYLRFLGGNSGNIHKSTSPKSLGTIAGASLAGEASHSVSGQIGEPKVVPYSNCSMSRYIQSGTDPLKKLSLRIIWMDLRYILRRSLIISIRN